MVTSPETLNGALPPTYAPLLEAEGAEGFALVVEGLRTAVALGDLHRGAKFHAAAAAAPPAAAQAVR